MEKYILKFQGLPHRPTIGEIVRLMSRLQNWFMITAR